MAFRLTSKARPLRDRRHSGRGGLPLPHREPGRRAERAPEAARHLSRSSIRPTSIEEVAELARQNLSKSDLQYKLKDAQDKQAGRAQAPSGLPTSVAAGPGPSAPGAAPGDGGDAETQAGGVPAARGLQGSVEGETDEACARYDEELKAGEEEDRKAHELRVEKERRKTAELEQELKRDTDAIYVKAESGGYRASGKEEPGSEIGADPREGESRAGYDFRSGEGYTVESGCCERCFAQ